MGITKEDIARINELAHRAKSGSGLNEEELAEQKELRQRYIDSVKANLRGHLDNIDIKNEDGTITHLSRRTDR